MSNDTYGEADLAERKELRDELKPPSTPEMRRQWAWEQARLANEQHTCGRRPLPGLKFGRANAVTVYSADGDDTEP